MSRITLGIVCGLGFGLLDASLCSDVSSRMDTAARETILNGLTPVGSGTDLTGIYRQLA